MKIQCLSYLSIAALEIIIQNILLQLRLCPDTLPPNLSTGDNFEGNPVHDFCHNFVAYITTVDAIGSLSDAHNKCHPPLPARSARRLCRPRGCSMLPTWLTYPIVDLQNSIHLSSQAASLDVIRNSGWGINIEPVFVCGKFDQVADRCSAHYICFN